MGYADAAKRPQELARDQRLLELEYREQPNDPFTLFNLGSIYHERRQPEAALPLLRQSIALSHPTDSIVHKLFALVAQCHRELQQPDEALQGCREGLTHYPNDAELLFFAGLLHADLPSQGTIVAVTHGGPIEALLGTLNHRPMPEWLKCVPSCGTITPIW